MKRRTSAIHGTQRPRKPAVMWIGILSLLLSLMSPLLTLEAATAQGDEECAPGFVPDPNSGNCVEEGQAEEDQYAPPDCNQGEIYDENTAQCVPDPSLQPQEQPTGVQIDKYDCPAASDVSSWNLNQLQTNCPANQRQVQMTFGGEGISEDTRSITNYTEWTGNPPAGYFVFEQIPDGYGQPRVFCGVYIPQQTQPSFTEMNIENGSAVGWGLDSGEYVYCQWYNIQEDAGYGEIHLTKYDCAGYQGESAQTSRDDLLDDCDQTMQGVEYEVYVGQNLFDTQSTDNSGKADWDEAPVGEITIAERLPDGYAYAQVYCAYHEANQPTGTYSTVQVEQGWFHSWDLEDGYILDCTWFNFEEPGDYEPNWFEITKYICDYDTGYDQDKAYYEQECSVYTQGVDFEFTYPNGDTSTQTTDNAGKARWTDFPDENQGEWSVQESIPTGYGDPVYFCQYVEWPQDAPYTDEWQNPSSSNGYLESGAGGAYGYDGVGIQCHVYNFAPEDDQGDYNWIDFYKYTCAYDLPTDGDYEYYLNECAPTENWEFDLQWDGGGSTGSTDNNGYYGWSEVPTGSWSASETLPDGYGQPKVWCQYLEWPDEAGYDNSWFPYDPSGGQIDFSFDYDNVRIECYWFNFAPEGAEQRGGEYNYLDFYKYVCAYDVPKDQDYEYYLDTCEVYPGWNFNVQAGGSSSSVSTNQEGMASWSGLPVGQWSASESLPGGYGDPVVWCQWTEWPDGVEIDEGWNAYGAPGGYFEGDFKYDGMRYVCYWFNFEPEGGNTIQFYKMWCSEQATYDSSFNELVNDHCEFRSEPASVSLTYNGSTSSKNATEQQPAEWQGVPQGEWTVEEAPYEGWAQPIIWCQYVQWPDTYTDLTQEAFMLSSGAWQGTWDTQYDGVTIACVIFNIPYQQNWIELTKWYCAENIYLPYEQSVDNLYEECERYTDGASFDLQYTGGSEGMTTDGEGQAEWGGIPSGPWTIAETVPEGYGDPVVYCRYLEWPEAAGYSEEWMKYPAPGGTYSGEFEYGGVRIYCDVFNIPYNDPGTITVYKWNCPEGVPADSSAEYLRDTCYPVTDGVDFNLAYGQTATTMTTDSNGKAVWNNVPQGTWNLTEYPPTGYGEPVFYCQWTDWSSAPEGELDGDLYTPDYDGYTASGTFEYPGLDLVCYVFNFEYDGGDNWVTFYKYTCAPGSSWSSLDEWIENCSAGGDGSSFTLATDQGTYPKTVSGGTAEWTGLDDGEFSVSEALPSGYENPVVWCTYWTSDPQAEASGPKLAGYNQTDAPEGAWGGSFKGEGNRYTCYIFNIPGNDNSVTVYKYNCDFRPVGYNTLWQWQEACETPGNDVGFTLDNLDGSDHQTTVGGNVEWTSVPLGEFSITEDPYAGYGEAVWWCGWTAYSDGAIYDAFPQQVPAPGNVYNAEMTVPGTTWFCYVFNIPADESRITVYKYTCPEGVLFEDTLDGHQSACTEKGDGIEFTLDNSTGSSSKTITGGTATWYDVPEGEFTLTESVPTGYGEPVWWCGFTGWENGAIADGFPQKVTTTNGSFTGSIDFEQTYYYCWVFNFPDHDREVTVYKWSCPEGMQTGSESYEDWAEACTTKLSGVHFGLTDDAGSSTKQTNASGWARWYGVEPGTTTLQEQELPGYDAPYVFCSLDAAFDDGAAYAENYQWYSVTDRSVSKDLGDYGEFKWTCHFFNIPKGPGEITIVKWYCPPGYNVQKPGANPQVDCTQYLNDVNFVLDQPVGPNLMATTGDAGQGTVYFGDLMPGNYVVTEQLPPGMSRAFVWDCYGAHLPAVHPTPLSTGTVLNVKVVGGDSITCHWYNVPPSSPSSGSVTLYKYQCSTPTYVSEVDCELYEFGASFDLKTEGGVSQGTGTTNAGGVYIWDSMSPGTYTLDELNGAPCNTTSTNITPGGDIVVQGGNETIVKVYNCSNSSGKPGGKPGGKVPTKYPNTGVGEVVFGPVAVAQGDDDDEVIGPDDGTPTAEEAAAEFYTISCLNDTGTTEMDGRSPFQETPEAPADEPAADEEDGGLPPFLQPQDEPEDEPVATEAPAATDEEPTEADANATTAEECVRGSVPQQLVIDAANVNYQVEVLEILDGVMQAPTGSEAVSWYKETARLGEANNIVIAGHLNWWGVPQGPFYYLNTLEDGDRIEITGEDGNTYIYEVQWVRQEDNLAPPEAEVVGPTGEQTLTLITCGGEWDASISEYNERTVVRAIQVDMIEATTPGADTEDQASIPAPLAFVPGNRVWLTAA